MKDLSRPCQIEVDSFHSKKLKVWLGLRQARLLVHLFFSSTYRSFGITGYRFPQSYFPKHGLHIFANINTKQCTGISKSITLEAEPLKMVSKVRISLMLNAMHIAGCGVTPFNAQFCSLKCLHEPYRWKP